MAMSAGGGGGLSAEPNVTPMIDVLLVLLIIFMLIVPMARKAIDLQLPDPNPQQVAQADDKQIVLEVGADGSYLINKGAVARGDLEQRIHQIYDARPDKIIFVKGDPKAKYAQVISAIDVVRGAGVKVIGITPKKVQ